MMLTRLAALSFTLLIASRSSDTAESQPYEITVLRNEQKTPALALPFWSGEYPLPVIDVLAKTPGKTKIKAFPSLRDLKDARDCTIKHGVYSPWSKTEHSATMFYSIVALRAFESIGPNVIEGTPIKLGDRITKVAYLAEGQCLGSIESTKSKKTKPSSLEFSCTAVSDPKKFKEIVAKHSQNINEQWLLLNCAEGYQGFIMDKTLLAHPGVREGRIKSYGEVGPVEDEKNP